MLKILLVYVIHNKMLLRCFIVFCYCCSKYLKSSMFFTLTSHFSRLQPYFSYLIVTQQNTTVLNSAGIEQINM